MLRFIPVFLTSFLLSINFGVLIYVNSSFLERFFSPDIVSLLFLLGSALNILLFLLSPRLLKFLGKKTLLVSFLLVTAIATLGLALADSPIAIAISFVVYSAYLFMAYYCLDIFLEELSNNAHTGEVRGLYFTFFNGGMTLGPLLVAFLAKGEALGPIYALSAVLAALALLSSLFIYHSPHIHTGHFQNLPFRKWWHSRNIRAVTLAKCVLETFFALMVIYAPIYLHEHLAFTWSELGVIFTVMLLPFVVLEWPAGEIADRWWGEKEIMSIGFFLTGTSLLVMPFLGHVFSAWLIVLLISRIGASLVEISTESYFFKKISHEDTGLLSIFRLARPASIMLGAVIGAISLNLFSFEKIFFVSAVIVFFGLKESLYLKDTL